MSTTTTQRSSSSDGQEAPSNRVEPESTKPASSEKETKTVRKEETASSSHGLIGGIFYLIGEIVAFPFKLIGGIFDAIF